MKKAFTIIRVSKEDQLKGYGPDVQWFDDVLPNAPILSLEVGEELRRVIQEPATGWDREKFQEAVREALRLYGEGKVQALLFPRVDRETRFVFGSLALLAEVVRTGMEVWFARDLFRLDPSNTDSVQKYMAKAIQAQAYAEDWRMTSMAARRRRAENDHMMPTGGHKWAFDYLPFRKREPFPKEDDSGRYTRNEERAAWIGKCAHWLLDDGASLNECCRRLDKNGVLTPKGGTKWARPVLRDILKDPALIGEFYAYMSKTIRGANGKKRKVATEPNEWFLVYKEAGQAVLTPEEFYGIQERLRRNQENSPRHAKHWYPPLRGMVICAVCGKRMSGVTSSKGTTYYKCEVCGNRINARRLWGELQEGIKTRLLEPQRLMPAIRTQLESGETLEKLEEEGRSLRREKAGWEQSREKARRLHLLPNSKYSLEQYFADDGRMVEQIQRVDDELAKVRQQITELRQAMVDEEAIKQFCDQAARNLNNMDDAKWRVLLERMRLKVVVPPCEQPVAHIALPALKQPVREIALETS